MPGFQYDLRKSFALFATFRENTLKVVDLQKGAKRAKGEHYRALPTNAAGHKKTTSPAGMKLKLEFAALVA